MSSQLQHLKDEVKRLRSLKARPCTEVETRLQEYVKRNRGLRSELLASHTDDAASCHAVEAELNKCNAALKRMETHGNDTVSLHVTKLRGVDQFHAIRVTSQYREPMMIYMFGENHADIDCNSKGTTAFDIIDTMHAKGTFFDLFFEQSHRRNTLEYTDESVQTYNDREKVAETQNSTSQDLIRHAVGQRWRYFTLRAHNVNFRAHKALMFVMKLRSKKTDWSNTVLPGKQDIMAIFDIPRLHKQFGSDPLGQALKRVLFERFKAYVDELYEEYKRGTDRWEFHLALMNVSSFTMDIYALGRLFKKVQPMFNMPSQVKNAMLFYGAWHTSIQMEVIMQLARMGHLQVHSIFAGERASHDKGMACITVNKDLPFIKSLILHDK